MRSLICNACLVYRCVLAAAVTWIGYDICLTFAEEVRAQRHLRTMFSLREVDAPASERRVSISEDAVYVMQYKERPKESKGGR